MTEGKPVFLKTYGKRTRKLNAWVSPDDRRLAFESSASSHSIDESKAANVPAKRPPHPTSKKPNSNYLTNGRGVCPAKNESTVCPKMPTSDEDSLFIPPIWLKQQNKMPPRKVNSRPVGRPRRKHKRAQAVCSSDSEADSTSVQDENAPKRRRARGKKGFVASPPSLGRFVTKRRGGPTSKVSTANARALMPLRSLNSSDDFATGRDAPGGRRILRPARWRAPLELTVSNTEDSMINAGNAGSSANPFPREMSISESNDRSLGPCPRKPLYCSTPSARPPSQRLGVKTNLAMSPYVSLSDINTRCLSPSREELGSSEEPFPPLAPAPGGELSSVVMQPPALAEPNNEPEDGVYVDSSDSVDVRGSRSKQSVSSSASMVRNTHNDGTDIRNGQSKLSTRALGETEGSSHFVSAAGGLEWLVQFLKDQCLTNQCTVKLDKMALLVATHLHGQTTYSSCLNHTGSAYINSLSEVSRQVFDNSGISMSGHATDHSQLSRGGQTVDHLRLVDGSHSFHLHLTMDSVQTIDSTRSMNKDDSADPAHAVTDDEIIDCSQSLFLHQSVDRSVSQLELRHQRSSENDNSADHIVSAHRDAETRSATLAALLREECLSRNHEVQLKRITLSQHHQQVEKSTHSGESSLVGDGRFIICTLPSESKSDSAVSFDCLDSHERSNDVSFMKVGSGDSEGDTPRGGTPEREKTDVPTKILLEKRVSDAQSVDSSRSIGETGDTEVQGLESSLKEKCLTSTTTVQLKKMAPLELPFAQRVKESIALAPSPEHLRLASEDQNVSSECLGSEYGSDKTERSKGRRGSRKIKENRGALCDPNPNAHSHAKQTSNIPAQVVPARGKKASKGKRKRSVSRDRPGTTRKACVRGLSVSRWKDRSNTSVNAFQSRTAQREGARAGDCSITELLPTQHTQAKVRMDSLLQGSKAMFSTPVHGKQFKLSSLLTDLTPSKYTWSCVKAAMSVHRKTKVFVTPKRPHTSVFTTPGRAELIDVSHDLFMSPFQKSLPRHLQAQLLERTPLSLCGDDDLSDEEKVCAECGQQGPLPWEECILPQQMKRCKKIGEGTFGEVFSTLNAAGDAVALKIIPVEGMEKVNGVDQKTFGEILHEIIISKELSGLKGKRHNQTQGFIGLNDLHCVRGCYPPALLKAWDAFDRQKGSENDRPDFFEENQVFLILEFEFGGSDLENSNGTLASLVVAKGILHQVTVALAVAEQELCFEHRDLHWGNVLVKTTKEKKGSFVLNGTSHSLDTKGVLVRIIDYSLSRLEIDGLTVSCDISTDEELFMGQGDYQFDIYRLMRQENGNNWEDYQPHSNVLWLHYLSSKLLHMKYRGTGGRAAKDMREELSGFHDNVLQYRSATEALQNCPLFRK